MCACERPCYKEPSHTANVICIHLRVVLLLFKSTQKLFFDSVKNLSEDFKEPFLQMGCWRVKNFLKTERTYIMEWLLRTSKW